MTDLPSAESTDRPWIEPPVYDGDGAVSRPAIAYDGGQVGRLSVRAGSALGFGRAPRRQCNDAFAIWAEPSGEAVLLAVADGAGRSEQAGRAATLAVNSAMRLFREWAPGQSTVQGTARLDQMVRYVIANTDATLAAKAEDPQFRTTLVVAAIPAFVQQGSSVDAYLARVGDSSAWSISGGQLSPVFPAGGASATTNALPGHAYLAEFERVRLGDGDVLALVTDGLLSDGAATAMNGFLSELWAVPPTPLQFLGSLATRHNRPDDDRAAAVAWVGHYEVR